VFLRFTRMFDFADFVTNGCRIPAEGLWVWIAGHRIDPTDESSHFRWKLNDFTSLPMTYTNWAPEEPNNQHNREDCVHLYDNFSWNDMRCENKYCFLCEVDV